MQPVYASAPVAKSETLSLLFQSVLTGIVRIQAGRQALGDLETFRRRMKGALQEAEKEAARAGYGPTEIKEAEFAVVAFLDETILSSKETKADEWRKRPLNIELFGQAVAGDVFFEKLADIENRRDSPQLADLLEIYLLCLLLGFEGRFSPPLRGEVYRITERVRSRIEALRGLDYELAPPLEIHRAPAEVRPAAGHEWLWWSVGALAAAGILFLAFWLHLSSIDHIASSLSASVPAV
ncbi:MAG TPA: DotU family type IV/VI secretion system protein [Bryobacteraceae bacterium]